MQDRCVSDEPTEASGALSAGSEVRSQGGGVSSYG